MGGIIADARNDTCHNSYSMHTFELSEQQLAALKQFLLRTELKGAETGAFNELVNIFFPPAKPEAEKK